VRQGELTMTRSLVVGAIVTVAWLVPQAAGAQSRATFTPSLSIGSVYDDNLFARTVGSGDQMTLFSPGIEASFENPRLAFLGLYTFDMQRSFDHPALNELEARRHALIDSHYRRSQNLTFTLVGRYDLTQTAGELNFNTGLLLDRHQALRWEVNPSVAYQVNTRTTVNALYDRTTERIIGETSAFEDIARFTVTRQKTPRATIGFGYSMRHFINGDETHTSNAVLFGSTYALSPATMFTMQVGPRLSSRGTLEPDITASIARRAINAVGYSVDVWRGESIILGVLGPVEVLSTTSGLMWPIRRTLEMGVHGGLFDSTTLSQGKARVYHAEAVAAWSPTGPVIVAVSYGADFQRGDIRTSLLADKKVVRHLFQVRLTVAPHLSRSFQPEDPLRPLGEPTKGVQR
jgi:hypothetical protein